MTEQEFHLNNYWLIVVEEGSDRQQYQVYQQASEALLMDLWMRRMLESGHSLAAAQLYWVDEGGSADLRIEMRVPAHSDTLFRRESDALED